MWEFQITECEMAEVCGLRYPDPVSSQIITCDDNSFDLVFNKFLNDGIMSMKFLKYQACRIVSNVTQCNDIEVQTEITILYRDKERTGCPVIVNPLLERLKTNKKFLLYAKDRVKKNKKIFGEL